MLGHRPLRPVRVHRPLRPAGVQRPQARLDGTDLEFHQNLPLGATTGGSWPGAGTRPAAVAGFADSHPPLGTSRCRALATIETYAGRTRGHMRRTMHTRVHLEPGSGPARVHIYTWWLAGRLVPRGPRGNLCTRREAELGQDVGHVTRRGSRADHQLVGDLAVGQAPGDEDHDLVLARGKRAGRLGRGQPGRVGPGRLAGPARVLGSRMPRAGGEPAGRLDVRAERVA